MEVISGEKIVKSYGKFKVLKGINLNVQDGEFVWEHQDVERRHF